MIAIAVLLQLLIVAGALYDTARLLSPAAGHHAVRVRRHRAALEAAEGRLVGQRLRGRIDAAAYRERMRSLAEDRPRPAVAWHRSREAGPGSGGKATETSGP
ncbi:hypothetical protein ACH4ZX_01570 [Streptomyces sp. NPDC020490]|uniref:hypothetical protein n=1 Tax=Streptomyces sp. NPDC020490 TaxID=3365078 RepID=UPI0037A4F4AD